MARIDKATVDKILDATNIVDVVSDFVSLKKAGSSYVGLCPFHNDRTPSFRVSPSRGIFKCFACGKGGTAVSFLMDMESMNYVEALKWLGRKYNIEVKERELTSEEREADALRESLFAANEFALRHFEATMATTEDGRNIGLAYFRERGINDATIAKFHLGYALEKSDDFYRKATSAGFPEKSLVETGLVIKTENGRLYDRFKGRVIYPVHSLSGRVVAFGGRTLRKEKTVAKYVNSPESAIYSKSNELYGMYQARNAIARKKNCILVEGYMDVLSMHQSGVENVVASSGTSLTEGQIRMIKRFADSVTLIYDSDAAGIKASLRGINLLLAAGLSLKVVLLPEGDDPDSFAQAHSSTEVEEYIESHKQDLIGFKTDILLKDAGSDPRRRSEVINDILQSIAIIPDLVEQSLYLEECSRKLGVASTILAAQLKKFVAARVEENYKKRQIDAAQRTIEPILEEPPVEPPVDYHEPEPRAAEKPVPQAVYMAEEELIRYVLRRGLLYMCDVITDDAAQQTVPMSIIDFIECELRHDNVEFSVPRFRDLWQRAIALRDGQWPAARQAQEAQLLATRASNLALGLEQIRQAGGDSATVIKAEESLVKRLDDEYNRAIDSFSSRYIHEQLLRTDDRQLTDLIVRLTTDNVVLSKMYPKVDVRAEDTQKLPIAIANLKGALVKEELKNIAAELSKPHTAEEFDQLMQRFKELKLLSMEFDKFNGEIVITPKP